MHIPGQVINVNSKEFRPAGEFDLVVINDQRRNTELWKWLPGYVMLIML